MKVGILDDWADTLRTLSCFDKLAGHDVTIWNDHVDDAGVLAERLKDIEALVLIRERTAIRADLLARLPKLRLISQRGVYPHIDVDDCLRFGVVLSSGMHAGTPSYGTAELTWVYFSRRNGAFRNRSPHSKPACGKAVSAVRCAVKRSAFMATVESAPSWPDTPRRSV
jgi:phosphoglycerate dehydrogenase-like enzyme